MTRMLLGGWLCCALALGAQEVSPPPGWQASCPTGNTHRLGGSLDEPHGGGGCGFVRGTTAENRARACFTQEFHGRNAVPAGKPYRYAIWWRTARETTGRASILIDSYGREGEKSRRELLAKPLAASEKWQTLAGTVTVPEGAVRVRMLLYLHGVGAVYYDDAWFGEDRDGAPNLLRNPGFEPPGSARFDLMPGLDAGGVQFTADFANGTIGATKRVGPEAFYIKAHAADRPAPPFLWFHFQAKGVAGREVTFHVNPAPFGRDTTGGNGTRSPVASYDGETWFAITDKSWNEDGTVLTFRHRFERDEVYLASFYPFAPQHIERFVAAQRGNRCFSAKVLAKTPGGRDQWLYTITDPDTPAAGKRAMLFTTLQHDLETTGAWALEGMCRYLLSDSPGAALLRRQFVVYVVPQMDPDGVANGNRYHPAGNLNRQWGLGTAPETQAVERFAKGLAASGQRIELVMDFHGWCTPERQTQFMSFGKEICDALTEADALRLSQTIGKRLQGKVSPSFWRKMVNYVTMGDTDVRRLMPGWLKYEAGARLAYSIEIFGEGECTQQGYLDWGRAFGEGIAEFYGGATGGR